MAIIAPSILSADFANLARDVSKMEHAGAQLLHVDVMDGHFVPNLSIGVPVIEALKQCTSLPLDVHLMISNPEEMLDSYIAAGADYLSVHFEAVVHLDTLIEKIREKGVKAGVVLNPHTSVGVLEEILPKCNFVLLMSVNPGFGGQKFISASLQKVQKLRSQIDSKGLETKIEIDGGVGPDNTEEIVRAGVDIAVAGSAIFHASDPGGAFQKMQRLAEKV